MAEEPVRQEDVRVIRVSDYSTDWPAAFDQEAQRLIRVSVISLRVFITSAARLFPGFLRSR